jgi:nitrite reductase/ring-hydroxylating ferredoxin subunit/Fe-S cluster biogenesis protein NfuA
MGDVKVQGREAGEVVAPLNALVEELERYPDTEIGQKALDLVQIIMDLYGEALRRVLATVDTLPLKDQILSRLVEDEVVRAVLLIHGLMPVDVLDRVVAALDHIRPYLLSQGGDVKLLGIEQGRARLRLLRSGAGAAPVAVLKQELENALNQHVPDLLEIEIEGVAQPADLVEKTPARHLDETVPASAQSTSPQPTKLIQIRRPPPDRQRASGEWVPVIRARDVEANRLRIVRFGEINLLVCNIGGLFYAYHNACASGQRSLDDALFESPMLTCSCHGYRYDLKRQGACIERPELHLDSLRLIVENEKVKVAL